MLRTGSRLFVLVISTLCFALPASAADVATYRSWIEEMKQAPRGPFQRIRWFCADGEILPPKAGACADHGGGIQHGQWNERARGLRKAGYGIGNVLAELEPEDYVGDDPDLDALKHIVLERFLIAADHGWILQSARNYRGAFQVEDEEAGARAVMLAILGDEGWNDPSRFALLRELVRWLPLQGDSPSASDVRILALEVQALDAGFADLRAKIHSLPDAQDARRVRDYAAAKGKPKVAADYERLASSLDQLYAPRGALDAIDDLSAAISSETFKRNLEERRNTLEGLTDPSERIAFDGKLLEDLRDTYRSQTDPVVRLALLRTSAALERDLYTTATRVVAGLDSTARTQRLAWVEAGARALYGVGFLSRRHLDGVQRSLGRLRGREEAPLKLYRQQIRYLARAPEWAGRWLHFHFGESVERFHGIEPLAQLFPQDRLRGSPLLFYSAVVDSLVLDANALAGIEHSVFGRRVGAGLRALNPGLARGTLYGASEPEAVQDSGGIYLLPETTSDLKPVAGILTQGEGNSLSHIQLLARNLAIPNVVIGEEVLAEVKNHLGTRVVLAVSPGGVVELEADGPRWDAIFGREEEEASTAVEIAPDLEKLNLVEHEFLFLDSLRATDSGRVSGPKGANLGELRHAFGEAIPNGFVIPFGVFRALLDRPLEPAGPPVFEWMKSRYAAIAALASDPAGQEREVATFLSRLRTWIETVDPGAEFGEKLKSALDQLGPDGEFGVFVRSDTNVEDLPGFTGAGLNLTVPNVMGYQNILEAIGRVWASPFTERAYAWRQAHMDQPEYVFPAVLVQYSFPSEKSGVMVTADVVHGEPGWMSVAVNEGVGGAVDGQAAESLRIEMSSGATEFLAQATAPRRRILGADGGLAKLPATGTDRVLTRDEVAQLVEFARGIPERFPSMRDESGQPLPADVEFAFRGGKLALLQMRPFVESKGAQQSRHLAALDGAARRRDGTEVELTDVPAAAAR